MVIYPQLINISTTMFKKFALLFSFIATFSLYAQQNLNDINVQTVLFNTLNDQNINFFNGKISLNDNTTLTGEISLNHKHNGVYTTILKSGDLCKYIPNNMISTVILNENKTTFIAINNSIKLYREVFKNTTKNIVVYDTSEAPFNGALIAEVFVKENDQVTNTFDFWTSGPKQDLINYLRKRDRVQYKRKDFNSLQDIFETL